MVKPFQNGHSKKKRTTVTFVTLLDFLNGETLPIWVYSFRKEFAPKGANSFLEELIPIENEGKKEIANVASPENIHIHHKSR